MPELPEVEEAAGRLRSAALGKTIVRLRVLHPALARRFPARDAASVAGATIRRIERRGKHQLLHLDDGRALVVHFRMTGDWEVGRVEEPEPRFARAALDLADGTRVTLADPRALATLTLHDARSAPLPALGPEANDPAFTAEHLGEALAARRGAIKPALLDQRVVAGLGNIYAAEALWRARISPRASARALSLERRRRLVRAIRDVLDRAPGGRYWIGEREARWKVYDREGKACPRCGSRIRRITQAGRSTYYCPRCQRS
jgi:formamidopyrimidine-DNA glycosylase